MSKYKLKLKNRHPNNAMRIGKHVVTNAACVFDLDENEEKELKTVGCQHWFAIEKVTAKVEPAKVEPAKVEPAKVEPAKVEPAKVEPAKVEPAKVEPAKVEVPKEQPKK